MDVSSITPGDLGIGLLFETISEVVIVADVASERIVLWNPAAERLFGFSAAEAVGMPIETIVAPELRDLHHAGISRYRATGHGPIVDQGVQVEVRALHRSGAELVVELSLNPLPAELHGGTYVMALIRDVSDRAMQRTRRDALIAVARYCAGESDPDRVLRALLEAAVQLVDADDAGIARWDEDRQALIQVHSFLPSTSEGTVLNLERSASGRAAQTRAPVIINDYPRGGDPDSPAGRLGISAGMAVPLLHEGRLLGTLSVSTVRPERAFVDDDAGALELLAGIGASALVGLERTRLQAALVVRNEVLAEVSHDLKTPLTAARGQVQLLQRHARRMQLTNDERLTSGLDRLDRAIVRMADLIDELRDVAQLEAGQMLQLDVQPIDLVALARERIEEHEQLGPNHRFVLENEVPRIAGVWDGPRLARVLDNLLGNAVKYSAAGSTIEVLIDRATTPNGTQARLRVRDQGVGIPAADLPRVFDRFHRAENVRRRVHGSGLGLAGARQIVELHGGRIEADSVEGAGSTFTVLLPLGGPAE